MIKKYISTNKHPILKEGTIIKKNGTALVSFCENSYIKFEVDDFNKWIGYGYIVNIKDGEYLSINLSLNAIHKAVSRCLNVSMEKLYEKTRCDSNPYFRKLFCYFSKTYTRYSMSEIGQYVGWYDHSTVHYNHKWISERVDHAKFKDLKFDVLTIKKYLNL